MILLVVVGIVIIAIVIIKGKTEKELEENPSKIPYSDDLKKKELLEEQNVKRIYVDKSDIFIIKCPNCEVENRSTNKKCYVCNYDI